MVHFLTMGYDCSPAAVLRNLNLRPFALPFDWTQCNIESIHKCFADDFAKFHTNLRFNHMQSRMIDEYGIQFPHDYPFENSDNDVNDVGEGKFGEEKERGIIKNWYEYYDTVKEKYNRRIDRFRQIVRDPTKIIVLCRYSTHEVMLLQKLFEIYYKRNDIIFINASKEIYENNTIKNIDPEMNGEWNDAAIWKKTIDEVMLE
jgi:hypothetical protein